MAHVLPSVGPDRAAPSVPVVPRYREIGGGRLLCSFRGSLSGDADIEVTSGRIRSYPGLVSEAPRTELYYRAFSAVVEGRTVLDAGCGAGTGLVHLEGARSVVGLDRDEAALGFARASVRGVRFESGDVEDFVPAGAEVVTLVDVLGSTREPRFALDNVGRALGDGGLLCLAEPKATVAQGLLAPVRRAFSKSEILRLLRETGYRVLEWISDGAFLVLVAERRSSPEVEALTLAHRELAEGRVSEALAALARVPESSELYAAARLLEASLLDAQGRKTESLGALLEAQRAAPAEPTVLAALATASLALGAPEDAVRFSAAALEVEPTSAAVAFAVARSVPSEASLGERIAAWLNAARLAPADVDVAVSLARVATECEAFQLGVVSLERLRDYHAVLPADYHLTVGWLYLMIGRLDDALLQVRLVKVLEPEHPGTDELLGAICESSVPGTEVN